MKFKETNYYYIIKNNEYLIFENNELIYGLEKTYPLKEIPKNVNIRFGYSISKQQRKEILKLISKK